METESPRALVPPDCVTRDYVITSTRSARNVVGVLLGLRVKGKKKDERKIGDDVGLHLI